jgi:hypothetical protein
MGFQERVTIFIETKVEGAKGALSGLKSDIGAAEGGFGKLKAAAGGIGDALGLAMPGIGDVVGKVGQFAVDSVLKFQDLGLEVGKLRDSTGLAADDAARWIEVVGDAGINTDSFATSVGRLEKNLGTNKDAMAEWGVEVVTAKDGTVDMNATLINAFETLRNIEDPTKRAAAGAAIFGKSWADMSELVEMGADGLTTALGSVSDAKVLDDADVQSARDLRDSLDALKGVGEDLALTFGKNLAPALSDTVEQLGPLLDGFGKLADIKIDGHSLLFTGPLTGFIDATKNLIGSTPELQGNLDLTATAIEDTGAAAEASKEDIKLFADANKDLQKWVNDALKALQDQAKQLEAQSGAYTTAADDQIAYNDALAEFDEKNKDAKASTDDVRDAAIAAAKAHVELYDSTVQASGATATATGKIDAQNESLITAASTARGPAKQGILDYIGAVNGIPPEKMTAIKAAIEAGDLDEAKRLLDEASAPRDAAMVADANKAALAQTNKDLDAAAHDRTVNFNAQAVGLAALTGAFQGAVRAAGGTVTNNTFNVQVPRIPNARELARVNAQWARVNGGR